jgi:hypothetical protein
MVEIDSRKAALIAEIEVSRSEMRGALRRCEANLNPAEVVRKSVRSNSGAWLSAAALLGLALSQIVRLKLSRPSGQEQRTGRRESDSPGAAWVGGGKAGGRSWILALGRLALDLVKPVLADWAAERLAALARAKDFTGHPQTRNGVRRNVGKKEADWEKKQPLDS